MLEEQGRLLAALPSLLLWIRTRSVAASRLSCSLPPGRLSSFVAGVSSWHVIAVIASTSMATLSYPLRQLLLSRDGLLVLSSSSNAAHDNVIADLEGELLELGWMLSADVLSALGKLDAAARHETEWFLLQTLRQQVGAHVDHVPLHDPRRAGRGTTPKPGAGGGQLTLRERVAAWMASGPQPCATCVDGLAEQPMHPCGHLVCGTCASTSELERCPICGEQLHPDGEKLQPAVSHAGGSRLRMVRLAENPEHAARSLLTVLLERTAPLTPADRDAAMLVLRELGCAAELLPARMPARETMAVALHMVIDASPEQAPSLLQRHCASATDVLRVATALMGGDPALFDPPPARPTSLRRSVRAALLDRLQSFDCETLCEDIMRRAELWKRIARGLHPFERPGRRPGVTLAFALLRRERTQASDAVGAAVRDAAEICATVTLEKDGALRHRPWAAQLEEALAAGAAIDALRLLSDRPSGLLRRLDHLLRVADDSDQLDDRFLRQLESTLSVASSKAAPALLLTVAAHLRHRTTPHNRRMAQPKGTIALAWASDDTRRPLDVEVVRRLTEILDRELLARAAARPPVDGVLVDEALADVPAPLNERAGSAALVTLPRGSRVPLPDAAGHPLRFFVHWTEPAELTYVDLDLSVAFFDAEGEMLEICDFTRLSAIDGAAQHSGDLTSAPAPLGATEYVDLDVSALRLAGVRHVAMTVFSFNGYAFDALDDAFAGIMHAPRAEGFDAAAVLQRFDLHGETRVALPLVLDLEQQTMQWVDLNLTSRGGSQSLGAHSKTLGPLIADLQEAYASRPTMLDLALIHAAARSNTTDLRARDGNVQRFVRLPDESDVVFLQRLRQRAGAVGVDIRAGQWLGGVVSGSAGLPAGSVVWSPTRSGDGEGIRPIEAAELVDLLSWSQTPPHDPR